MLCESLLLNFLGYYIITGKIEGGLPSFQPPPFAITVNVTRESGLWEMKDFGFGDMVSTLGAAIIIIPVIAILESVAIAKAFGIINDIKLAQTAKKSGINCTALFNSRGQVCGRQPGDGRPRPLQHLRLLRPVHANHRQLLQVGVSYFFP